MSFADACILLDLSEAWQRLGQDESETGQRMSAASPKQDLLLIGDSEQEMLQFCLALFPQDPEFNLDGSRSQSKSKPLGVSGEWRVAE